MTERDDFFTFNGLPRRKVMVGIKRDPPRPLSERFPSKNGDLLTDPVVIESDLSEIEEKVVETYLRNHSSIYVSIQNANIVEFRLSDDAERILIKPNPTNSDAIAINVDQVPEFVEKISKMYNKVRH